MRKNFSDMTTEELIKFYAYISKEWTDEIQKESREKAQLLIKKTLKKRFASTIEMLDDWQTKDNPEGTFKNILLGIY